MTTSDSCTTTEMLTYSTRCALYAQQMPTIFTGRAIPTPGGGCGCELVGGR